MPDYSVRGFSQGTGSGTADVAIFGFWNPSSTRRLIVREVHVSIAGLTGGQPHLVRTSARGTPNSTVTPDADNDWDSEAGPNSGALLDLAVFSVQPTLASPRLWGICQRVGSVAGSGGTGWLWTMPGGLWIPAGSGIAAVAADAATDSYVASECSVAWEEH